MTKQIPHTRHSKNGKPFVAGDRKEIRQAKQKLIPLASVNFKSFLRLIKTLSTLSNDVILKFSKNEGLTTRFMDPANVSLIDVKIGPKNLVTGLSDKSIGVNLDYLKKALLEIRKSKNPFARLDIDGVGLVIRSDNLKTSIHWIEPNHEFKEVKMPNLDQLDAVVSIGHANFLEFLDKIKDGYSVRLTSKPGGINWQTSDQYTDNDKRVDLESGVLQGENTGKSNITSEYSVEYLQTLKHIILEDKITLKFGTDYPLLLEISSPDKKISFILAPRVKND